MEESYVVPSSPRPPSGSPLVPSPNFFPSPFSDQSPSFRWFVPRDVCCGKRGSSLLYLPSEKTPPWPNRPSRTRPVFSNRLCVLAESYIPLQALWFSTVVFSPVVWTRDVCLHKPSHCRAPLPASQKQNPLKSVTFLHCTR